MYFDTKEFGSRLKELRLTRGLTQEALAEALRISLDYICRVERGSRSCSIDLMIDIAAFFGVSLDYLILGKETDQAENQKRILSVIGELSEIAKNLH